MFHSNEMLTWWLPGCKIDCCTVLIVPCSLVITCCERADHLALSCVMFRFVFVTFLHEFSGKEWHLIVSIHDLCLLFNFI